MVGGPNGPEGALVVQGNGHPHGALSVPAMTSTVGAPDVLRGGMDANTLLHSLRRRWLLATCVGIVLALLTATVLWFQFPPSSSATAMFRVSSHQESIAFDVNRGNASSFDVLKKTHLAMLKSYFVLQAAARKPGVVGASALAGHDPVEWLMENLDVQFPQNGELLAITLSGNYQPEELKTLVDAVSKAYEDEVLFKDKQKRLSTRDLLSGSLGTLNKEIQDKGELYLDIASEAESSQADRRDAETELLLHEITEMTKKKSGLETQLFEMQTEYALVKGRLESPSMIDMQVEEMLKADPAFSALQNQLSYAQMNLSQSSMNGRPNSRGSAGMQRKIAQLQNQIAQHRASARQQLTQQRQTQPDSTLQQLTKDFQTRSNSLRMQYAQLQKTLDESRKKLEDRVKRSTELDTLSRELDQLEQIATDMTVKLESLEIEASAPPQIVQVQPAIPSRGTSKAQQMAISSVGGLAAFALGCFIIGYLEFRGRRLNDPDQVDEGLGIRVIGTLPSLSSRHALDPGHPIVAQLTESIDGVRTILMHDSTSKRRQVVLVTSAATMEGRTTVASQLAASLARAGRRTLLIDGDLRRPALHALFDVPLEDGLCEVLRAEVDVDDVIRPTHAEGLWLLTAGYCDVDAIHALATEQMQPVFDKLRNEYDFVIIDGAPIVGMSDALIFGQYSDGAILSVRRDHSQVPKINHAAELLRDVGIRIIGAVVNGVPTKADDRIIQLRLIAPKSERELQPTA
jgi:polysaccharide biosynthesis transport protein